MTERQEPRTYSLYAKCPSGEHQDVTKFISPPPLEQTIELLSDLYKCPRCNKAYTYKTIIHYNHGVVVRRKDIPTKS